MAGRGFPSKGALFLSGEKWPTLCLAGLGGCVRLFGLSNQVPWAGALKQPKLIFSRFRELKGVGRVGFF